MGDSHDAAAALAHMPRWVAIHENALAKVDAALSFMPQHGYDVDDVYRELDEAREERDRATGPDYDGPGTLTIEGL